MGADTESKKLLNIIQHYYARESALNLVEELVDA